MQHAGSVCRICGLSLRNLVGRGSLVPLTLLLCMLLAVITICLPGLQPRHPNPILPTTPQRLPPFSSHIITTTTTAAAARQSHIGGDNSSVTKGVNGRYLLTVIPRGRLGNQMFQYASLLGIAEVNGREPFVTSSCKVTHYFANASVSDRPVASWDTLEEINYAQKDPAFDTLPLENLRLRGFFQSWRYFTIIAHKVRSAFVFHSDVQQAVHAFFTNHTADVGREVLKIGVHVRRTDMLHKITRKQGYVPAPLSYLKKALQHMRDRFSNRSTIFFIVSDDRQWCGKHLLEKGVRIVDWAPSVVHLGFLALCDHVIMTVGTFGWWAAYLSGGHVVYYAGYPRPGSEIAEGFNKTDFYLPQWVAIGD